MLARFTVGNFLSFNENQSLCLVAGSEEKNTDRLYKTQDLDLLKFASIFGANAAGKSNVIKAMAFAQQLVLQGTASITVANQFYRMNPANKEKPSYFEFEVVLGGVCYAYGFEVIVAQKRITEEWLYRLSSEEETPLFTRNCNEGSYFYEPSLVPESLRARFDIYLSDMQDVHTRLFLHHITTNKAALYSQESPLSLLPAVYRWFVQLAIAGPVSSFSGYSLIATEHPQKIGRAITRFATGISSVQFRPIRYDQVEQLVPSSFVEQFRDDVNDCNRKGGSYRLQVGARLFVLSCDAKQPSFSEIIFEHKDQLFSYEEESDGVRRLFDLLSVLVTSEKETVFLYDEIDRSLHPQMTLQFIRTYLKIARTMDIQLIITTHESHLLDLKLLRRDEIFFVEKGNDGSSVIYPFDQFQQQLDGKLEQAYLNGRYGGVPLFTGSFLSKEEES
ncbi:MAG: ATP-binding protein [Spirochaetia bacterium]|nr:ATP-binding protein [Spirochaetia bacterium]